MAAGAVFRVRGQVQGVGFRPFVWRVATGLGLSGHVLNDAEGVLVEAAGAPAALDALERALRDEAPPLARVEAVERRPTDRRPDGPFRIAATTGGAVRTRVTPDAAICPDCRAEIADPAARRHRYPFTNCTHCGPRFSIVTAIPYDRGNTTMAGFPLCEACTAEYADPADRRFHAQPVACPACGPRAWFEEGGAVLPGEAVALAAARLAQGAIVAVKGLGGFHLACDARDAEAIARLRARKRRPTKPFALMARDAAMIARHARVDAEALAALADPAAPVVLLDAAGAPLPAALAPGQDRLGWMLPYTPLHVLLLDAVDGPLVMTSGNLSGEPQVIDNEDARQRLSAFADGFLMHDRPIARRLDDSVAFVAGGRARLMRRGRGHAPATLALPPGFEAAPPVLAYGGHLKAALCLAGEGRALMSQHLGDLDEPRTWAEYRRAEEDCSALFDHRPVRLACDAHPGYRTTLHAADRAAALGLPLDLVQHHHAHVAAAMAENGWPREGAPVLGVAFDGLGWGEDGTIWGGEFLLCTYRACRRVGWLRPVPLPGGDLAQREPWRPFWAHLVAAGIDPGPWLAGRPLGAMAAMVAKGVNAPLSSSAGRLFDAVAWAAGLAPERLSHEGEAAMALESAARRHGPAAPYPLAWDGPVLHPTPLWHALLSDRRAGTPPGAIAAGFHAGLAAAVAEGARRLAREHGAGAVALTGGVFQNATLLETCLDGLDAPVLTHAAVPAGDGGLALGQATIAMARAMAGPA